MGLNIYNGLISKHVQYTLLEPAVTDLRTAQDTLLHNIRAESRTLTHRHLKSTNSVDIESHESMLRPYHEATPLPIPSGEQYGEQIQVEKQGPGLNRQGHYQQLEEDSKNQSDMSILSIIKTLYLCNPVLAEDLRDSQEPHHRKGLGQQYECLVSPKND